MQILPFYFQQVITLVPNIIIQLLSGFASWACLLPHYHSKPLTCNYPVKQTVHKRQSLGYYFGNQVVIPSYFHNIIFFLPPHNYHIITELWWYPFTHLDPCIQSFSLLLFQYLSMHLSQVFCQGLLKLQCKEKTDRIGKKFSTAQTQICPLM